MTRISPKIIDVESCRIPTDDITGRKVYQTQRCKYKWSW